jgi:glutathione peroxidase
MSTFYDFKALNHLGNEVDLKDYKDKVVIVVNTASKCGFTPQYEQLEELYQEYHEKGVEIIAFPCNQFGEQEQGSNDEIQSFCQLNYGLTFPVFSKIEVNGENEHPLYTYLKSEKKGLLGKDIKWNFTKFLIDKNGNVVKRYAPQTNPLKMKSDIEELIK